MFIDHICQTLQKAMPGGDILDLDSHMYWDDTTHQVRDKTPVYSEKSFRIGPHLILFRAESDHWVGEWRAGAALRWNTPVHKAAKLDECKFRTEDDVIGWASWIRQQIIEMVAGAVCAQIQPGNLFPEGGRKTSRTKLRIPIKTLTDCGIRNSLIPDILLPHMRQHMSWNKKGNKHALRVRAAGEGVVVGRFTTTNFLEWRVRIPLDQILDKRGLLRFVDPPTQDAIQDALTRKYLKVVLNYVMKILDVRD